MFELKPAKFYLCPFKRHGKLADFFKIVLKIYIYIGERIQRSHRGGTNGIVNAVAVKTLAVLYSN